MSTASNVKNMLASSVAEAVQDLSSLDHALLLSLIAKQHFLIETTTDVIDDVAQEISLIASDLFGLTSALVQCSSETTLEDLNRGILLSDEDINLDDTGTPQTPHLRRSLSYTLSKPASSVDYSIANIVVLQNLNAASRQVQVQALELITSNRIFTHTSVYQAPKPFLLVLLSLTGAEPLNAHLNDAIFLSHYHDTVDELPRLDAESLSGTSSPPFPYSILQQLSALQPNITLTSETRSYLITITVSIRTHRALTPGSATPAATRDLELLSRCLALLHGTDYVSPALVALAARKVYRHRLRILKPEDAGWERSMMYGSQIRAVKELLTNLWMDDGATQAQADGGMMPQSQVAEAIVESVLSEIEVPV